MPKQPETHAGMDYCLPIPRLSIDHGMLRADAFDDVYFSVEGGLAETRHVFLEGNDLYRRMQSNSYLSIAETGFGSGLNLLALMAEMTKAPDLQVDYLSVEAFPLDAAHMTLVHDQFPELSTHAAALQAAMPPRWPGHHLLNLMGGRLTVHLLYGAAGDILPNCDFAADCWFLDGFTPAKNPDFWSPDILKHIGRLTKAGGSFASFTAAAAVRTGLADAGFTVEKRPGFGRKREMIAGWKSGRPGLGINFEKCQRVGIIGGGIAGAAVAAGLSRRGASPVILDAGMGLATGASGNRYALQSPRLAVDHNLASQLSASCHAFAATLSDQAGANVAGGANVADGVNDGVIAFDWPEREAVRHAKFRKQSWPSSLIRNITKVDASAKAGVNIDLGAMCHDFGRVINPKKLVQWLAIGSEVLAGFEVKSMVRTVGAAGAEMTVTADDGRVETFDAIVVANGAGMPAMLGNLMIDGIALDITSGQVSHIPVTPASAHLDVGLSFGGYLTPAVDGFHEAGATFDRDPCDDVTIAGHQHNLQLLPPCLRPLFTGIEAQNLTGRTSRRASTPDRNPVWGSIGENVFVLGALGARGFTFGPLLGDQLGALILGRAVGMGLASRALLDPFRFRLRASRLT